jgi:hypothetical protein
MAYIGKTPTIGNFQKCDAITVVNGQAAYTMQVGGTNVSPESENHMLVSLNGILQAPVDSFTISGSTITFASNLATGDVIDFIMLLGNVLDLGVPSDNTVTAAKLNNDIISGQTALTTAPADTDEFLVSDAGTIKRIDYSLIKSTPGMVLIDSGDSTTAVAQLDFTMTSDYDDYIINLSCVPATDATTLRGRIKVGGTVQTGTVYGYGSTRTDGSAFGKMGSSNGDSYFGFHEDYTIGNQTDEGIGIQLNATGVNSTIQNKKFFWNMSMQNLSNANLTGVGSGTYLSNANVVNGFRFYFSSGNIARYNYRFYGLKNS